MGDIYQNAYVVIAAANGWDANQGLRGIRDVPEPRSLATSDLSNLGRWNLGGTITPFWYTRGWTFQEMVLARRLIVFHYQFVLWDCAQDVRHETADDTSPTLCKDQELLRQLCRDVSGFVLQ